jgi:predicted enzyme related to lactoylglutathione lyase
MPARFAHVNLIGHDWRRLAEFYQSVFGCEPVPPVRNQKGDWLDRATGIPAAHIEGVHLRVPGHGPEGPTLEIFGYAEMPDRPAIKPNTPGFSHIAFAVDDVGSVADEIVAAGGTTVGERMQVDVSGMGQLLFQYVADPEGNIIELQKWS